MTKRILVVCYSREGTTANVAKLLARSIQACVEGERTISDPLQFAPVDFRLRPVTT